MNRLFKLASAFLLIAPCLSSSAQELGVATVAQIPDEATFIPDGGCGSELYYVGLKWPGDPTIKLNDGVKATIAIDSESPQLIEDYWWDETWGEEEDGTLLILNIRKIVAPSWSNTFGKYTITVPAGLVSDENGATNAEQVMTFTLYDSFSRKNLSVVPQESVEWVDENWNDNPPPTYTPSDLSSVSVSWKGVTEMIKVEKALPITATNDDNTTIDIDDKVTVDPTGISLDLSSLAEGTWIVRIPQGYVLGDDWGDTCTNADLNLTYMITGEAPSMSEYQILKPANPEFMTNFTQVSLSFSGQPIVFTNPNPDRDAVSATPVTVNMAGQEANVFPQINYDEYENSFNLIIDFYNAASKLDFPCGKYEITIPEGLVKNVGEELNEIISLEYVKYTVLTDDDVIVTPEDGEVFESELGEIKIEFDGFDGIIINDTIENGPTVSDGENDYSIEPNDISVENNILTLKLKSLVEGKTYTVSIPKHYIIADDYYLSGAINAVYTIKDKLSGITLISTEENGTPSYKVYTLDGMLILDAGDKAATSTLPAGIYIINGKKVKIVK